MINWALYARKINADGESFKDRQVNSMKSAIMSDFDSLPSYRDAYINNASESTPIQVISGKTDDIKLVLMQPEDGINTGDILDFDDLKWLCVSVDKTNPVNESGTVFKCTHTLDLYKNGLLSQKIPCCVEASVQLYRMGINEGKYINIPEGTIVVRVPNTEVTSQAIKRGNIYKFAEGETYKVVDSNSLIEKGLLVLKMEWTAEQPEAPQDPKPIQPIEIIGSDSIVKGKSEVYIVTVDYDVVFTLEGNLATISSFTGKSCTIQARQELGYITLVVKSPDGTVESRKQIRVRSIF